MRTTVLIAILLAAVTACSQKTSDAPKAPAQAATVSMPAGHPQAEKVASERLTGEVVEALPGGGFTYVRLRTGKGEQWVVLNTDGIRKGSTITVLTKMSTENFESKSLGRTFDRVTFASLDDGTGQAEGHAEAAPAMSTPMSMPMSMPPAAAPAEDVKISVPKADKTVAEVWAGREALKDKQVAVRGKVVKALNGIMGKNWVHIRDGSGSHQKGDDDLTVTTDAKVAVGDVVLATGIVRVDKDFGSGYRYGVILEDAKVAK